MSDEDLTSKQRYYKNHREERIQASKDYAAANKEKKKAYYAKYYQKHKEELKAKHKEYFLQNKSDIYQKYNESYGPKHYAKKRGRPHVEKVEPVSPPVQEPKAPLVLPPSEPDFTFTRQEGNFVLSFR